jgi:hypothetical protein
MATRVTEAEVKAIIDTDLDSTAITPFITVANMIVTDRLADEGLTDELLKEIERWLSAHFVSIRDPRMLEEKAGQASAKYALGNPGNRQGISATPYGQQALLLDPTGRLASADKLKADMKVMG